MANRLDINAIAGHPVPAQQPHEVMALSGSDGQTPSAIIPTPTEITVHTSEKPAGRRSMDDTQKREKKNFFISSSHCQQINLLAKYLGCGPGKVVDMALDQLFSNPDIKKEIRKAAKEDRLEMELLEKSI